MSSDKQKRQAIDRIAQKVARQSNISHQDARQIVVKHINRAENKRS
jgi:hypothetical protein